MAEQPAGNEAELSAFLETAGQSLAQAQGVLGQDLDLNSKMVIASADLEVKAAIRSDKGQLSVQPISAQDIRQGGMDAGVISTLRISFVATADEPPAAKAQRPTRSVEDVIATVRAREDVANLDRILGGLQVEAVFVPDTRRWLVTARDSKQRVVREVVLADEMTEVRRV